MEWPRYEDGDLVVIGGAVASGPLPNIALAVEAIEFTDGCTHVKDGEGGDWSTSIEVRPGRRVKRPSAPADDDDQAEPDSWECVEEESQLDPCEYFEHNIGTCKGCAGGPESECRANFMIDIVRRCRALAERGA